ncbi:MAG: hypothetical protein JWP00_183 [Chloroflexi bacterium]|jgi:hypothetical protein|nr:hypothetical protein [Chloroflexota bacterium]
MLLSKIKGRAGKAALALGLGLVLAWSVLVGGQTSSQQAGAPGANNVVIVADGVNPPPGSG